ncbi:hypothetical protein PYX08_20135 [Citrobacter freundii]|nr:hypothetical protein [Citrobacter freundii]
MKPTYEELEKKCALQQSKLAAINELMGVVEKASDIAKAGIEELQSQNADLAVQLANAESKCRELAAENVTLNDKMNKLATWPGIEFYSSAWEFCNLDGNDALEFMCDVKTPATDVFLAEVRASAIRGALDESSDYLDTDCVMDRLDISYEDAELRTSGAIELHDALVAVANQLRKGE